MISADVLGMRVAVVSRAHVQDMVLGWCRIASGHYVCVANVHMCMETYDDAEFRGVVNGSDLTVPDGLPLVWAQWLLGHREAQQVRGEDLTLDLCRLAEEHAVPVGLLGGSPQVLQALASELRERFPALQVRYAHSPPFRETTPEEDSEQLRAIRASGVRLLFVGLGCPKQERWMGRHRPDLPVVMLGVGAAFDFIAGNKRPAPVWLQRLGLEWLFRLGAEPRRLWRRYLRHNPRFVWHLSRQLVRVRGAGHG